MNLVFDLAEDELQVWLVEADEHLQMLDEGFVQLERLGDDPELLQAIFRAAHTLKGSAGVIGHRRMAELTHALETVMDGLRKGTLSVTVEVVDTCLETLDVLKLLRNEVIERDSNPVDVAPLVEHLTAIGKQAAPISPAPSSGNGSNVASAPQNGKSVSTPRVVVVPATSVKPPRLAAKPNGRKNGNGRKGRKNGNGRKGRKNGKSSGRKNGRVRAAKVAGRKTVKAALLQRQRAPEAVAEDSLTPLVSVCVDIAPDSVASAARAFQVLMALQSLGDVRDLQPPQSDIESAMPVPRLTASLATEHSIEEVACALKSVSEVTRVALNGEAVFCVADTAPAQIADAQNVAERAKSRVAEKTVRTSVERLDSLMDLVGELITDRNRLNQIRVDFESRFRSDDQVDNLVQTVVHVGRITDQLQEEVMRIRMLPVSSVFNRFPRLVRDLARKAGKEVELVMRGEDTELDRSVIEEISDPLVHLLRNSIDHGLESPADRAAAGKPARGTALLTARHEENHIILTVEDDGRGIDEQKVKAKALSKGWITEAESASMSHDKAIDLIFRSGLSTATTVTDISGRGVGLDIVRANIERLNGSVVVETWPGKGTRFQIVLPLTLAIVPALLVKVGQATLAVPLVTVMETLRVPVETVRTVTTKPVIQLRGHVLPLVRLSEVLQFAVPPSKRRYEYVVAVRWGKLEVGLMVDTLVGEQELVIKSLGALLADTPGVSGAAILGDGRVALIIDVPSLFNLAGS
ncbi:MAG: chemotaxis protein CheA [Chloroflexi bacterium]|nr:chemotaxis protein CheA [Chloroflexota bacterium]